MPSPKPTMLRLQVDESSPSLNVMQRMHWAKRKAEKARWGWLIRYALEGKKPSETFNRVAILRSGLKKLDYDNLVGGMKSVIVDNLRDLKLIEDDNPDSVKITYKQITSRKSDCCTTITLTNKGS